MTYLRLQPVTRLMTPAEEVLLRTGLHKESELRSRIAFWQRMKLNGISTPEEAALFTQAVHQHSVCFVREPTVLPFYLFSNLE